ncbi:MAG: phenylalanine--tRNA ligase subunit beta [Alphaproteobacteria bacterium]|nr:phenylalanine--tRNA ligase subunit beta [Alphaproteobacteria bacterium]
MKFTINWLKQHLDTEASDSEICDKLTDIGLELESFEDKGKLYENFKVAYVEQAEKHPDADRLKVCKVKTENGHVQVVCGAPNAKAGMKGIFAPEGSYIPGLDVTLTKSKIRGVESCGMLVSEKEMMLSDEHKGIIELDEDYEIGTPITKIFDLDAKLIEIGLTPNRADCAGVRGIARDLAAAGLGTLIPQDEKPVKGTFKSPVSVKIEDKQGCPMFLGRMIKNIKNAPSPDWLQDMLHSIGLRPISALVDITNFMAMDQCRPLHVYDANKLKGNIIVRKTKGGETLEALNDKTYENIPEGGVAITDDSGIIGLGGIIGGTSTGCTGETTDVFLEAAYFDPMRIARTGRDIGIESDARYRFERGVDPEFTKTGIEMATQLILELCGTDNTEISEIVQAGDMPKWQRHINYDSDMCKKLCGIDIEKQQQVKILKSLGFDIKDKKEILDIVPPPWRGDVHGAADIVEEVVRIYGFDKIPALSVTPEHGRSHGVETLTLMRTRLARTVMAVRGMDECVTWSFIPKSLANAFGSNDNEALSLLNPISSELDQMRPSILPNLIEAAVHNTDQGLQDAALCEVGPIFRTSKFDGQGMVAAGIRTGNAAQRHWTEDQKPRKIDLYDAKADALEVLKACGAPAENAQVTRDAPSYYHPGRSGALRLGKNVLAYFGVIHPSITEEIGLKGDAVGFEVYLENIPAPRKKNATAKPLLQINPLQPLTRDFAFVVKDDVNADDLIKAAIAADKKFITEACIFDVYAGKGVEDNHKSLALSITIQPLDAALNDAQIEEIMQKVIKAVSDKTGGVLRG